MQVEHVTRIRLPARRTAHEQGDFTVGPGVLGEVVVYHQHIFALLHEFLADGAARVGRQVLQGRGVLRGGHDHDGVLHGSQGFQFVDDAGHQGLLLADGHVDTNHVPAHALAHDGVQRDGRLARLPVADDELPLAPADGNHGVNGLDARMHRRVHVLALHHPGGDALQRAVLLEPDGAFAVQGLSQGVDDAANQAFAHGHRGDAPCGIHPGAFPDALHGAHDDDAHVVLFQVEGDAQGAVLELNQLLGPDVGQAGGPCNTVAGFNHIAHLFHGHGGLEGLDLLLQFRGNLVEQVRHCPRPPAQGCRSGFRGKYTRKPPN